MNRYLLVGGGEHDMTAIVTRGWSSPPPQAGAPDLALLFHVLLRLQGLGRGIGMSVRVTELLQPYFARMIADRFNPRRVARNVARSARSWEHLVSHLADDVDRC